jgi:GNAT superfamily N-acetyltransferase
MWSKILTEGSRTALVAEQPSGIVIGWSSVGPSRDPDADSEVAEVYTMYVDPSMWRTGTGRALWAACVVELRKSYAVATLWTLRTNVPARRFYESCGFACEPGVVRTPDRGLDEIRYRRRLADAS